MTHRRPEDLIQRAIVAHYRARAVRGTYMFAVPNGGYRRPVEAAILKATGTIAGIPDTVWINRRASTTFSFEVGGLAYTATFNRFADGRIGELFLSNHKSNSQADTNARDAAKAFSFAVQHGADVETIRKALCRDGEVRASGPLGAALDLIAEDQSWPS
jgi:hypothetical protein